MNKRYCTLNYDDGYSILGVRSSMRSDELLGSYSYH